MPIAARLATQALWRISPTCTASPDGLVYSSEALSFYLDRRPSERLFNRTAELGKVLERTKAVE